MVVTKFQVYNKVQAPGNDGKTISLRAVYDGSEENKDFFKYTPAGNITLSTVNDLAAEQLVDGQEYYVYFSKTKITQCQCEPE